MKPALPNALRFLGPVPVFIVKQRPPDLSRRVSHLGIPKDQHKMGSTQVIILVGGESNLVLPDSAEVR